MLKSEKFAGKNGIFATRLKKIMKERGVTQQQLADYLNITRQAVSLYLTGQALPDIDRLSMICTRLGVSSDYLLGLSDEATINAELRTVCEYTGLSEDAIKTIQILKDKKLNQFANEIIYSTHFKRIVELTSEIYYLYQAQIKIANKVHNVICDIPGLYGSEITDEKIGKENYEKILEIINPATVSYFKSRFELMNNEYNPLQNVHYKLDDRESILDITLMRLDAISERIETAKYTMAKLFDESISDAINSKWDCTSVKALENAAEESYYQIVDFFGFGNDDFFEDVGGDSECPQ